MPHIGVDTESDFTLDPPLFLGFSLAFGSQGMYFPVAHMEDGNVDSDIIELGMKIISENPLRVFQNAGHDLQVLDDLGCPMWDKPFACTMIMAHMIDENIISKDLDTLHKMFTGGKGKLRDPVMQQIIDTMGWRYVPIQLMAEYGAQDAIAASELFIELEPIYKNQFGDLYD